MFKRTTLFTLTAVGLATSANAAPFLDDFSSDTSASYTGTDTFGSGGAFSVSGGTLSLDSAGGNTFTVFHNTAKLEVGETLSVDISRTGGDIRLSVSTAAVGPNFGGNNGFRLKYTGSTTIQAQAYGGGNTNFSDLTIASSDITLFITRDDADTLIFGHNSGAGDVTLGSRNVTGLPAGGLFVGVESFGDFTNTFDNLQIIPEPGSLALLGLGGLLIVRRRRG